MRNPCIFSYICATQSFGTASVTVSVQTSKQNHMERSVSASAPAPAPDGGCVAQLRDAMDTVDPWVIPANVIGVSVPDATCLAGNVMQRSSAPSVPGKPCSAQNLDAAPVPLHTPAQSVQALEQHARVSFGDDMANAIAAQVGSVPKRQTPGTITAIDSLMGTGRRFSPSAGWQRIDAAAASRCLSFPVDHGLHANIADEWYYIVGVVRAVSEQSNTPVNLQVACLVNFRSAQPDTVRGGQLPYERNRIVDYHIAAGMCSPGSEPVYKSVNDCTHGFMGGVQVTSDPFSITVGNRVRISQQQKDAASGRDVIVLQAGYNIDNPWQFSNALNIDLTLAVNDFNTSILLQGGTGYIGDIQNGNGYGYYSIPDMVVLSGTILLDDVTYTVKPVAFQELSVMWMDHQWGTIGQPSQGLGVAAKTAIGAGVYVPLADRGFGIVGYERWFGLQFNKDAPGTLKGRNVMVKDTGYSKHNPVVRSRDQPVGGDGSAQGTYSVTYTAYDKKTFSEYATQFEFALDVDGERHVFVATAVCPNTPTLMTWCRGDTFYEGGLILTSASKSGDGSAGRQQIGTGFLEQVGWDVNGVSRMLNYAGFVAPQDIKAMTSWGKIKSTGQALVATWVALLLVGVAGIALAIGFGVAGAKKNTNKGRST